MAKDTSLELRNALIYSVYVRNHTPEGTHFCSSRRGRR